MVSLDPQLAQLIASALQSDSDLSGLTGAVKNPLMMWLSGAYDPMREMQTANSELFSTYAGNPDYPGVNAIINLIQNGADKFKVMTAAKSAANRDIFDSATFDQLAGQLWEDYNENRPGGKNDWWAKNNLYRPEDVYSETNLPTGAGLLNYLRDYQSKETNLLTEAERLRRIADESKSEYTRETSKKQNTHQLTGKGRQGYGSNFEPSETPRVVRNRQGYEAGGSNSGRAPVAPSTTGRQRIGIKPDGLDASAQRAKERSIQSEYDAKAAEDALKMEQYLKQRFVKGYLNATQRAGVTPLSDQVRQMAQFLPKSK